MKKHLLPVLALTIITFSLSRAQTPLLWGMTNSGGAGDSGVIFNYSISAGADTVEHIFTGITGGLPYGSLIQANNGLLYGTTRFGGLYSEGALFSYDIATGIYTDIHDFTGGADGSAPGGSLMQASDHKLYGMAYLGGAHNEGTIFSYDISTDSETVLYGFGSVSQDGINPIASLIQASNGLLYGMTPKGGAALQGAIFSFDIATNSETVLYSLPANSAGQGPGGSLMQANDGNLYGMTSNGGINDAGTIFRYTIATNTYTDIFIFGNGNDGYEPSGSLMQASNGLLYGMTWNDFTYGNGTIFSFNLSTDSEIAVHYFHSGTAIDGPSPVGSLIQASDGMLYGMTPQGGANDTSIGSTGGTIFRFDIATDSETVVHSFGGSDGGYPYGNLIEVTSITDIITPVYTELAVYPNPAKDEVHIQYELQEKSETQLSLVNMLGEVVYQNEPAQESGVITRTVNTNMLSPGIYMLQLKVNGASFNKKVCVE